MKRFNEYLKADVVRLQGNGTFFEPYLIKGLDGVWLREYPHKKIDGKTKYVKLEGKMEDYIGYSYAEANGIISKNAKSILI